MRFSRSPRLSMAWRMDISSSQSLSAEYGLRLSTYSCPMIIGEVRRYLRDHGMVRVSRSMRDTAYKAMQTVGAAVLYLVHDVNGIPPVGIDRLLQRGRLHDGLQGQHAALL